MVWNVGCFQVPLSPVGNNCLRGPAHAATYVFMRWWDPTHVLLPLWPQPLWKEPLLLQNLVHHLQLA